MAADGTPAGRIARTDRWRCEGCGTEYADEAQARECAAAHAAADPAQVVGQHFGPRETAPQSVVLRLGTNRYIRYVRQE
jgi:hypothetical protein